MSKTTHQAKELANAFRDVIALEDAKAKLEVMAILRKAADGHITPLDACIELTEWAGK
jgi:hypothetical protein